jgi:hypothetical protein
VTRTSPYLVSLGTARRNQPKHPQQNDSTDNGGEQGNDEAPADHPEGRGEEPTAQERADDPDDQVSEYAVPMTAHHSPGQRTRDRPIRTNRMKCMGFPLSVEMAFTPARAQYYSINASALR